MKRDWLIHIRKKNQLTQEQVASLSYIDRGFYAQIENGNRQPSILVAKNIALALSFNPIAFFSDEFDDPFHLALINSSTMLAHFDLNLRYTWTFNPHPDFKVDVILGKTDKEIITTEESLDLMSLKQEIIQKGDKVRKNISIRSALNHNIYDVFGTPIIKNDKVIGGTTVSTDVTHIVNRQKM